MATNFDVLQEMGRRDMKIKVFPLSNVTNAWTGNKHGTIQMTVDNETVHNLMTGTKMVFALIVADIDQFEQVKAELDHCSTQPEGGE